MNNEAELAELKKLTQHSSLEQAENMHWGGRISHAVFEAYCHLWRNACFRFSVLCIGYERFEDLAPDTQALVTAFREAADE